MLNLDIILELKQRSMEMLQGNYDRKIGEEELYTIICQLEKYYKEAES